MKKFFILLMFLVGCTVQSIDSNPPQPTQEQIQPPPEQPPMSKADPSGCGIQLIELTNPDGSTLMVEIPDWCESDTIDKGDPAPERSFGQSKVLPSEKTSMPNK